MDAVASGPTVLHCAAELLGLKQDMSGTIQVSVFWSIVTLIQACAKGGYVFYVSQIILAIRQYVQLCSELTKTIYIQFPLLPDEMEYSSASKVR